MAFSTDGQLLASGGLDGIVNVWDSSTGSLKQRLEGPGEAIEVSALSIYTVDSSYYELFSVDLSA